jgi:hypothetical protein
MCSRVILASLVALLLFVGVAHSHRPGTDGGPADKGCKPVRGGKIYVGATNMSCDTARVVARKASKGNEPSGWRCTGVGTSFGHCHGQGGRKGRTAHWAVND